MSYWTTPSARVVYAQNDSNAYQDDLQDLKTKKVFGEKFELTNVEAIKGHLETWDRFNKKVAFVKYIILINTQQNPAVVAWR